MSHRLPIVLLFLLLVASPAFAAKALFDNYHAEQAGNADWVIDDNMPVPSPAQSGITSGSSETYWTGALSAWGVALVKRGYTVATNTAALTYGNGSNPYDLANYDVLIIDEPNTRFTASEATAILTFVYNGGGLIAISDHSGSDRNSDGYDSPMIWNALDPTHLLGVHFAVSGESNNNISQTSANVVTTSGDPVTRGPAGNVTALAYHNGTTMTLYPSVNPTVAGKVWTTGTAQSSTTLVMCATATYGSGRVAFVGDSSPADDGTGASGNSLYNGWTESGATDSYLFLNATIWATRSIPTTYTITASAGTGGTISPSGAVIVTAGGSRTFTIAANSGYTISGVLVDGASVGAVSTYTFSNVAANHTIAASFSAVPTTYTITASAGAGGTISPSGAVIVTAGGSRTFTIAANSGYTISGVLVDGASVGAVSTYTFSNVAANHTIAASFTGGSSSGYYPMASGNYSETFADVANWAANFASGTGASCYASVAAGGSGTIPNGTRTTVSTATWASGTTGGVQKGSGTLVLLTTGTTDNTSAAAVDLRLDFTGVTAGTLGFAWAEVANSTGDRKGSVRVYTSTDGSTFSELTAAAVLNVTNNVSTSGTKSSVVLPASFTNCATARIRFYYHNGTGGTTGSRPKISIDNVAVTSAGPAMTIAAPAEDGSSDRPADAGQTVLALARPQPNPSLGTVRMGFSLPQAGRARLEILDLNGRRVWASDGEFPAGTHSLQWQGRATDGSRVPAGVYFVRLGTPFGTRTARLVRL